jgi:16S rRNA G966 N2-methylase RsmD
MMRKSDQLLWRSGGGSLTSSFLDPPYRLKHGDQLMLALAENLLQKPDAVIVLEHESDMTTLRMFRDSAGLGRRVWRDDRFLSISMKLRCRKLP